LPVEPLIGRSRAVVLGIRGPGRDEPRPMARVLVQTAEIFRVLLQVIIWGPFGHAAKTFLAVSHEQVRWYPQIDEFDVLARGRCRLCPPINRFARNGLSAFQPLFELGKRSPAVFVVEVLRFGSVIVLLL